jgi:hypothetical protein
VNGASVQKGTDLHLFQFGQTLEFALGRLFWHQAQSEELMGMYMWQKECPVCRQQLEKKLPTETIPCPCGKYIWKG